jgi:hypothetical protein
VVVAAVDEGILQIIDFKSPDPFAWFYRKRGLSVETLCGLSELLPGLKAKEAVGGDQDEAVARRHLNPIKARRVKAMVWFSGPLKAGPDGAVHFRVPTREFHGEIRLMAMAAKGRSFGAATAHVKIDDPLIVESSLPRFLAPGDHFEIPVTVFNRSGAALALTVSSGFQGPVEGDGPRSIALKLEADGQTLVAFQARALMAAGKAEIRVGADCPLGSFSDATELPVRPAVPLRSVALSGSLGPDQRVDLDVPGGYIREGLRARLNLGNTRLLLYLRSLDYLIGYPYGCGEQLTSKAFPLLYFKELGLATGRYAGRAGALEKDVQAAIDKLARLQTADGGFAYWEGSEESDEWLSDYVTHFLLEADRLHYAVGAKTLGAALKRLGALKVAPPDGARGRLDRRLDNTDVSDVAPARRPYALYLKALAGVPDRQAMRAFVDTDRKTQTLEARCLVSLAYSALGDRGTARALLPDAGFLWKAVRLLGGSLDSPNREAALTLMALAQCDPQDPRVESLITTLGKGMADGHFGSTQDDSWAFRALGAALQAKDTQTGEVRAEWGEKGGALKPVNGAARALDAPELSGHALELHNLSTAPLYYSLLVEGTPLKEEQGKESEGIRARRSYFDESGKPLNLEAVAQGQLVVVRLEIELKRPVDNLVIADLLPAGLEIENPRLKSRGGLDFDPGENFEPANADFRDDRVLLFTGRAEGRLTFSYACRAVTPGRFAVPGLQVEAMYDPETYSRLGSGGELVVARRRP